jgi:NADPH2:quinone reductase
MKAVVVRQHGALESMTLEERPTPRPGPNQVLIDVRAAGINFPDVMVIEGTYQSLPRLPFTPGKELAGVVTGVGEAVRTFKPGDRVTALIVHGAYAEQVVLDESVVHAIPREMTFAEAAALNLTYLTSHFALRARAQLQPGEIVLVTGAAGGVGVAATQIAKALGATVLAAVSSPEKAAAAKASGADHIIDVSVPDLRNAFRDQVFAVTDKHGADVIIEQVGGDVFDASLRAAAWEARVVLVGFASGRIPEMKAGYILVKNIGVMGLHIADYRDRQPDRFRRARQELFDWYRAGKIKPHIMAEYPLEDYLAALKVVKNRQAIGKVILTMAG